MIDREKQELKREKTNNRKKKRGKNIGFSGRKHTTQSKLKMSLSRSGKKHWNFGGKSTFLGKRHTEETKRKISETQKGKILTEKHRKKLSEIAKTKIRDKNSNWKGGTKLLRGYKLVCIGNGRYEAKHRLVWMKNFGDIPNGYHIHHKNFNKLDNRIKNLQLLTNSEHQKLHNNLKNGKYRWTKKN